MYSNNIDNRNLNPPSGKQFATRVFKSNKWLLIVPYYISPCSADYAAYCAM